ncbi:MAG: DnaD domain protein [Bacilli bacterium]|nr:DnaD domain protein [Bacilli bacterium]
MKSSDILKSTNFTYNNIFINKISEYDLSLPEFLLLNYFINYNVSEFSIDEASKHLSLSDEKVLEAYNGLINKKIVKIKTTTKNGIIFESISLDDFYDKLDQSIKSEKKFLSSNEILKCFEECSGNKVTDIESEVINAWIQNGFEASMIINAINEAKYNGTCNIRYIDKTLNEWSKQGIKNADELEKFYTNKNNENVKLFDYDWLDEK